MFTDIIVCILMFIIFMGTPLALLIMFGNYSLSDKKSKKS